MPSKTITARFANAMCKSYLFIKYSTDWVIFEEEWRANIVALVTSVSPNSTIIAYGVGSALPVHRLIYYVYLIINRRSFKYLIFPSFFLKCWTCLKLNNCVGSQNYFYFFMSIISGIILTLLLLGIMVLNMFHIFVTPFQRWQLSQAKEDNSDLDFHVSHNSYLLINRVSLFQIDRTCSNSSSLYICLTEILN